MRGAGEEGFDSRWTTKNHLSGANLEALTLLSPRILSRIYELHYRISISHRLSTENKKPPS